MDDVRRKKPFFRADHVGSLLRPPELLEARDAWRAGTLSREALAEREDAAIRGAVRMQEEVGLRAVTDGEFRRENWWIDFVRAMNGIEISDPDPGAEFQTGGGKGTGYLPKVVETVAPIVHDRALMADDYRFLAGCAAATPKVTIPSPTRLHFHGGRAAVSRDAYPDIEGFWADAAAFYRAEIAALEEMGCRYVQIDDPVLTYFLDDRMRDNLRALGEDPDRLLDAYAALLDECVSARRPDTHLAMHLCRGNAMSAWIVAGGYQRLAEAVFPAVAVDTFFLEYDDERSGDFAPLRFMPEGRNVVLGLVTSKFPALESKDDLKRRIDEAARYVPMENLALSPQCGFASIDRGNLVSHEDQRAKLRLVVETAEEVWGGA